MREERYMGRSSVGAYEKLPGEERQMWGALSVHVLNVELRPGSPAANRRGKASTTHTRPAESLLTLKPWPKPWPPPTRTTRSRHISLGGQEHSPPYISIHNHNM